MSLREPAQGAHGYPSVFSLGARGGEEGSLHPGRGVRHEPVVNEHGRERLSSRVQLLARRFSLLEPLDASVEILLVVEGHAVAGNNWLEPAELAYQFEEPAG